MGTTNRPTRPLTPRTGALLFLACWAASFLAVTALRTLLIPGEERDCYRRVAVLQHAVDRWDRQNPDHPVRGDVDVASLVSAGLLSAGFSYDKDRHYYFVDETAHGWRVKCNRHADIPLPLRLTGVTLLALVAWVMTASWKRYTLFPDAT